MKPRHRIGEHVCDSFARRNEGTIIVLGNGRESWIALCLEVRIWREQGCGMAKTLDDFAENKKPNEKDPERNQFPKRNFSAGDGIRTREHLRDRALNPAPLTWLGNPRSKWVDENRPFFSRSQ